jgi:hypothetical protein
VPEIIFQTDLDERMSACLQAMTATPDHEQLFVWEQPTAAKKK